MRKKIGELEGANKKGTFGATTALQLAELYRQSRQNTAMMRYINSVLSVSNLPPQYVYQVATILHKAQLYTEMDQAIQRCLKMIPKDSQPELFLNITKMYLDAKMLPQMILTMKQYLVIKPEDWKARLDLCLLQMNLKQFEDALHSLNQALKFGGIEAEQIIRNDPDRRFAPLLSVINQSISRSPRKTLKGIPGIIPGI